MSESNTYEAILQRMLDRVDDKYDKRESSVIFNTLAPVALEFSNVYLDLQQIENEGFADTASMYGLTRRAAERGLAPETATPAVLKGKFDMEIEYGKRFTGINTTLNYGVFDLIEAKTEDDKTYYYYECECETWGEAGNSYLGNIIPIDGDISGLTTAQLTEILVHGEDDEDVETFRAEYFNDVTSQSFGGNIQDYKNTVKDLNDVGGCKIYPVWNGGGSVKVVIQDSTFGVPSENIISQVKEKLDPDGQTGTGAGLAPIGHEVTVEGVTKENVSITTTITYEANKGWADVSAAFYEAIDGYLAELNADWENQDKIVVRISQLESRFLNIDGVLDVNDTKINNAASNYQTGENSIVGRAE